MQSPPEIDDWFGDPEWVVRSGFASLRSAFTTADSGVRSLLQNAVNLHRQATQQQLEGDPLGVGDAFTEALEIGRNIRNAFFLITFAYFEGHARDLRGRLEKRHGKPTSAVPGKPGTAEWLFNYFGTHEKTAGIADTSRLQSLRLLRNQIAHDGGDTFDPDNPAFDQLIANLEVNRTPVDRSLQLAQGVVEAINSELETYFSSWAAAIRDSA